LYVWVDHEPGDDRSDVMAPPNAIAPMQAETKIQASTQQDFAKSQAVTPTKTERKRVEKAVKPETPEISVSTLQHEAAQTTSVERVDIERPEAPVDLDVIREFKSKM
jgi:hypothetical protein